MVETNKNQETNKHRNKQKQDKQTEDKTGRTKSNQLNQASSAPDSQELLFTREKQSQAQASKAGRAQAGAPQAGKQARQGRRVSERSERQRASEQASKHRWQASRAGQDAHVKSIKEQRTHNCSVWAFTAITNKFRALKSEMREHMQSNMHTAMIC